MSTVLEFESSIDIDQGVGIRVMIKDAYEVGLKRVCHGIRQSTKMIKVFKRRFRGGPSGS